MAAISQMHFCEWKFGILIKFSQKVCSQGSNRQQTSIGLDNGLAPNRQQANILTNANPIHWRIYTTLGGDKLIHRISFIMEL